MRRLAVALLVASCAGAETPSPRARAITQAPSPGPSATAVASAAPSVTSELLPAHLIAPQGIESKPAITGWTPNAGTVAISCTSAQGVGSSEGDVDVEPGATHARLAKAIAKCGAKAGARFVFRIERGKSAAAREAAAHEGADDKSTRCVLDVMGTMPLEPIEAGDGGVTDRVFECWVAVY